jgi:hypothetical protein
LVRFRTFKIALPPQTKPRRGGGLRRISTCPLNLRQKAARLEIRRNFFSNRVIEDWNMIPSAVKNARTVTSFKLGFKKHRKDMVSTT